MSSRCRKCLALTEPLPRPDGLNDCSTHTSLWINTAAHWANLEARLRPTAEQKSGRWSEAAALGRWALKSEPKGQEVSPPLGEG